MNRIKTAVVGAGKMGAIHAKVLAGLENSRLVAIIDKDFEKAEKLAKKYKAQPFDSVDKAVDMVEAATVSAPTTVHLELAEKFIINGRHVLIEKPLAASVEQGRRIVELGKKYDVIVAVGHSERCNPVVQAMKRLEIEPRFIESVRISPYSFRSTDIGVVHDMMIHDLDIILALARSRPVKVDASGVNVIGDHEDICNARITFENGCVANATASRLSLKTVRKVRVFSRQAYLSLDFFTKEGTAIKAATNVDVVKWIREKQKLGIFDFAKINWPDLLHIEKLDIDDREPLRVEQEAFLQAVADRTKRPEVTGDEGLAALECADMITQSIKAAALKLEI